MIRIECREKFFIMRIKFSAFEKDEIAKLLIDLGKSIIDTDYPIYSSGSYDQTFPFPYEIFFKSRGE